MKTPYILVKPSRSVLLITVVFIVHVAASIALPRHSSRTFAFPQATTFTIIGMVRNKAGQIVTDVRVTVIDENFQTDRKSVV